MPKRSFKNNENIAQSIKQRRIELGLTIEEAAKKAAIGTKTWVVMSLAILFEKTIR